MPKATKYYGIPYEHEDTVLSADVAYVQAARGLDVAFENAVQSGDRETMVAVSTLWIRLAESLGGGGESEDKSETPRQPLGFNQKLDTIQEDESIVAEQDEGVSGLHQEHGKLRVVAHGRRRRK